MIRNKNKAERAERRPLVAKFNIIKNFRNFHNHGGEQRWKSSVTVCIFI